jgi:alpha-aminoadipic semialdehyde synthase
MLNELGVEWIEWEQLATQLDNGLYACAIPPSAYLEGDGTYDRDDYYRSPKLYRSVFAQKVRPMEPADQIAPHLTTLINGVGWQSGFPRLMSTGEEIKGLVAIQDISCDLGVRQSDHTDSREG